MRIVFIFLLFISPKIYTQNVVSGRVLDEKNNPIYGAIVTISNNEKVILNFVYTDSFGGYKIDLKNKIDSSFYITINMLGYEIVTQTLSSNKTEYNFQLRIKADELKEIVVVPPIQWKGDTIIYNVEKFSMEEDRSILDVLKRMPGISIDDDGKISFNGELISNLYFQGDELMDGRYGAAIKVIKKEMIKNVEVLLNHQSIKVLQNKKSSDAISLNLTFTDENSWKVNNELILQAGIPRLYAIELNSVLLNKTIKSINSIQTNNIGSDFSSSLSRLAASSLYESNISSAFLNTSTISPPPIPKNYYSFNQSQSLSLNTSFSNSKDDQWKLNVVLYKDKIRSTYYNQTEWYDAETSIYYVENQKNNFSPYSLSSTLTYQANQEKYFLLNRLSFEKEILKSRNELTTASLQMHQHLRNEPVSIKNISDYKPQISLKGVLSFQWKMIYNNRNESLFIDEGLHPSLINNGIPYDQLTQEVRHPQIFNEINIEYFLQQNKFRQGYKLLFSYDKKRLESTLSKDFENHWSKWEEAQNDILWKHYLMQAEANYSWVKSKRYDISLKIPITKHYIQYDQLSYLDKSQINKFWFTPSFRFEYYIRANQDINFNAGLINNISNIQSIYRGPILTNYLTIISNESSLLETNQRQMSLSYRLKKPIQMFFLNTSLMYSHQKNNAIYSMDLSDNIQKTVLLPIENDLVIKRIQLNMNKYSFKIKSNLTFSSTYSNNLSEQLINDKLSKVNIENMRNGLDLETRILNAIQINYKIYYQYSTMKIEKHSLSNFKQVQQQFKFSLFPLKHLELSNETKWAMNKNHLKQRNSYLFTDLFLKYHIQKWRTNIEISCLNIANEKTYETFSLNTGYRSHSIYELRGRMILLKGSLSF